MRKSQNHEIHETHEKEFIGNRAPVKDGDAPDFELIGDRAYHDKIVHLIGKIIY